MSAENFTQITKPYQVLCQHIFKRIMVILKHAHIISVTS